MVWACLSIVKLRPDNILHATVIGTIMYAEEKMVRQYQWVEKPELCSFRKCRCEKVERRVIVTMQEFKIPDDSPDNLTSKVKRLGRRFCQQVIWLIQHGRSNIWSNKK